jgi:hypothetical protein
MSRNTLYYGSFVHSTSLTQLEYLVDTLVYVSDGSIVWIETDVHTSQLQDVTAKHGLDLEGLATTHGTDFVQLDERDFICPGLIDTHTVRNFLWERKLLYLSQIVLFSVACSTIPQSRPRSGVRTLRLATAFNVSKRS